MREDHLQEAAIDPKDVRGGRAHSRRTWFREPLLHFLAFGVLVYTADLFVGGDNGHAPSIVEAESSDDVEDGIDRTIIVDDALISDLERQLASSLERPPQPAEVDRFVNEWIADEMLVREARALGLDRGDPVVRAHLARKMTFVIESRDVAPVPDEDTIRAWYETHIDEFRVETRITLRHLFVDGTDEAARVTAAALAAQLRGGADPVELGEGLTMPPGGPVLRGRTPERLQELFGDGFVDGLADVTLNTWSVRRSQSGWHVVRVESRQDGRVIPFEEARNRAAAGWQRERLHEANARALEAVSERYTVERWPR